MMTSFNLIDEPWIPCLMADGVTECEVGLWEVLTQAKDIQEILDPSPVVTISVHRLLVAILHRNFGPADAGAWRRLWEEGWDANVLIGYFDQWRERFDLFDPERPFYQTAEVSFEYRKPITDLVFDLGPTNAKLFSHVDDVPVEIGPAAAARAILAYQCFCPGGLTPHEKGQAQDKYRKAAPLAGGTVILIRGATLFETLMLNLHRYNRENPFEIDGDDLPAWERNAPARVEERRPSGYVDWLTWQTMRIRLELGLDEGGQITVPNAVYMKGVHLPPDRRVEEFETMLGYVKNEKAKPGEDPWLPVRLRPDRALWRDSTTLFQIEGETFGPSSRRPRTLSWLATLTTRHGGRVLSPYQTRQLDAGGVCFEQYNVLFWRSEHLPLPLAYISDDDEGKVLRGRLGIALSIVNDAAGAIRTGVRVLCELLLSPNCDQPGAQKPDAKVVSQLYDGMAPARLYWGRLEARFGQFLEEQAAERDVEAEYGADALRAWVEYVRSIARQSVGNVLDAQEPSARALRAVTKAQTAFERRLREVVDSLQLSKEEEREPVTQQ